jgi:ATP:ADP antiporter, AAA family
VARTRRLERLLKPFADVRSGEAPRTLLLAANLFILLLAYYLLKTVREPLILGERGGGAEVKSYASACQAVLLAGLAVGFGWLANRVPRMKLITSVTAFFAANLVVFWLVFMLFPSGRLATGVAFFIWVGCFNVMIVAQFWAFAADLHSKETGERVFPLIAAGSAVGAVVGARIAKPLFNAVGPFTIMLITAVLLLAALVLTWLVHRGDREKSGAHTAERTLDGRGGFALLVRDRYLMLVAALSLLKNWVNTTGEYILDRRLLEVAKAQVGSGVADLEKYVAGFKSDYFTYVNVVVMVLQFFAVSRIIKYLGVRKTLFIMPAVVLCSYSTMAIIPSLMVILGGKIAENSTDYSVQKTVEQTLFLVASRDAKYKVKAIVDTFVVRIGDVLSAALVWVGSHAGLTTVGFIAVNAGLVGLWLALVWRLAAAHRERAGETRRDDVLLGEPVRT